MEPRLGPTTGTSDPRSELVTSRIVGVAAGVAMTIYRVMYEQAVELLQRAGHHQRRDIRAVADDVVVEANSTMRMGGRSAMRTLRAHLDRILER